MVTTNMLDSAIDMAKEEIEFDDSDQESISTNDIEAFRKRLNYLLDLLKEECE